MSEGRLRRTPLTDRHEAAGARMADFAGWAMPLDHGSVVAEHHAVREDCGVFDLGHLGSVSVTGPEADAVVQRALTVAVDRLAQGRSQYALCLDPNAGIIDDLLVYRLPWGLWTVPNAANLEAVLAALHAAREGRDAAVVEHGERVGCLAVQGPRSAEVLAEVGLDPGDLRFGRALPLPRDVDAPAPPPEGGVLARTGYTGELGYELFVGAQRTRELWDRLLDLGVQPAGLGARDTLRLEAGLPLHGNDLSVATDPVSARLQWATRLGGGFVGEQAAARLAEEGTPRRLIGVRATGRGVPRAGCAVHQGDREVGTLTSGTMSPTLGVGIGMGYLDRDVEVGAPVTIVVRGRSVPAEVVTPPFVRREAPGASA